MEARPLRPGYVPAAAGARGAKSFGCGTIIAVRTITHVHWTVLCRFRNRPAVKAKDLVSSGVPGLDDILGRRVYGGRRLYLIEGVPGSGKTTLALQFLMEGARRGEPVLYVTLSESEEEITAVAASHAGHSREFRSAKSSPRHQNLSPDEQYTMFHPSEVELSETTNSILADVERIKPTRVVFDSLFRARAAFRRTVAIPEANSGFETVFCRAQPARCSCSTI